MSKKEKWEYWIEHAEYDLETADAMYNSGRWVYVVFMCQQCIEKIVKALYVKRIDDNVPRIHNISRIIEKLGLTEVVGEDINEFADFLLQCYINGRYTDYKKEMSEIVTKKTAYETLEKSKEVYKWFRNMI